VNPHGNRHVDQGSQSWTNSAISENDLRAAVTHKDAFCIFWMKAQGDQDGAFSWWSSRRQVQEGFDEHSIVRGQGRVALSEPVRVRNER
jgi:hypothetical protein